MQRVLTTVTLLGLLTATAAAFVVTEHLKLIKSPIAGAKVSKTFSPVCHCATGKASIGLRLRHPDRLTLTIQDAAGHTVATIASSVQEPKGRVTFFWDGRSDTRAVVPDGFYRPQVELANARRTILLPTRIEVDSTVPRVLSASDGNGILVPRPEHSIAVRYALNEKAQPALYLGGQRIVLGRFSRERSEIKWSGLRNGAPLPLGRYVVQVGAVDLAGNETPAGERKSVVVVLRAIVLDPTRVEVHAGKRFEVSVRTAAGRYAWRFGGRHGTRRQSLLDLRAPSRPGRYRLVVSAHGHTTSATVIVGRK